MPWSVQYFACMAGNAVFHHPAVDCRNQRKQGLLQPLLRQGTLLGLLGAKLKLSRNTPPPRFLRSSLFRYGFLPFFMTIFCLMLYNTYKVFAEAPLQETVLPPQVLVRLLSHGNNDAGHLQTAKQKDQQSKGESPKWKNNRRKLRSF